MPAGAITTANTAAVWNDLIKLSPMVWVEGARQALEDVEPVMDLYDNDPLDQFNRDYGSISVSGFGHSLAEGADYISRMNNQGGTLSAAAVKRGDMFTITEDLVDGNKYREIRLGMEDLGASLFRTRARDATHVGFTFAFSSSYVDQDGLTISNGVVKGSEAIFADTHTLADGSNLDNNLADTVIGEVGLRNLLDLTVDFADQNGMPVSWGLGGVSLVSSMDAGMQHASMRLTTQDWQYQGGNRDINPFSDARARGGAWTWHPLFFHSTTATGGRDSTIDKHYYIVDRRWSNRAMIFANHTEPTPMGPFRDIYNAGQLWQSKARYDIGNLYPHHAAGCPATT